MTWRRGISLMLGLLVPVGLGFGLVTYLGRDSLPNTTTSTTTRDTQTSQLAPTDQFQSSSGQTVYVYGRAGSLQDSQPRPLVLFMMGMNGDPQDQANLSGWAQLAQDEDVIVLSPAYNNVATYSEVDNLMTILNDAKERYAVDDSRVYSLGFSNGGAASVALAARHPEVLAGISAYGWQVDLLDPQAGYTMPFQVIQGSEEATEYTSQGDPMVRRDTAQSIRSLLTYDGMIESNQTPDYKRTPYWGYQPDASRTESVAGVTWTINDYAKEGYTAPFAQLILIDGAEHIPNRYEARFSWDFLRRFQRQPDGSLRQSES